VTVTDVEEDPGLDLALDPVPTLQVIGEETKTEGIVTKEMEKEIEIVPAETEGVIDPAVEIAMIEITETTEEVVVTDAMTRNKMVANRNKDHEENTLKDLKAVRMTIKKKKKRNNL